MLIFSVVIFVFSTLTLSPVPLCLEKWGHDPPAPMGAPPLLQSSPRRQGSTQHLSHRLQTPSGLITGRPYSARRLSFHLNVSLNNGTSSKFSVSDLEDNALSAGYSHADMLIT